VVDLAAAPTWARAMAALSAGRSIHSVAGVGGVRGSLAPSLTELLSLESVRSLMAGLEQRGEDQLAKLAVGARCVGCR